MNAVYAQSKRVENLHLTRERDRRRGRELATLLLAGLPIACAFLVYAALHIETVRIGYTREARARQVQQLKQENQRLRSQMLIASSPDRVAAVAVNQNLRPPRPGQIQYIEPPRERTER